MHGTHTNIQDSSFPYVPSLKTDCYPGRLYSLYYQYHYYHYYYYYYYYCSLNINKLTIKINI
jgi:hypothetical protein